MLKKKSMIITVALVFVLISGFLLLNVENAVRASVTPVDPNANQTTCEVLEYLGCFTGPEIIYGQLGTVDWQTGDTWENAYASLGGYPGMYHWEVFWPKAEDNDYYINKSIVEWQKGSLVYIGWVSKDSPSGKSGTTIDDCDGTNPNRDMDTYNAFWDEWVEDLAGYLQQLEDAGVTVLFRPLHEPENRVWIRDGSRQGFRNVWQQLFNELCVTRGLNNLLWVLGLDRSYDSGYYPGDNYIDIVGCSVYSYSPPYGDDLQNMIWARDTWPNKLLAMTEVGTKSSTLDAMQMLNDINTYVPETVYMSFWDDNTRLGYDNRHALYLCDNSQEFFDHSNVYIQDEINFNNPPTPPAPFESAQWKMDNDCLDEVGDRDGIAYGSPVFTNSDKQEGTHSLILDGSNDYVEIPNHSDLNVDMGDFSITCWVKRDSNTTTNLRVVSKVDNSSDRVGYEIWGSDTNIRASISDGNRITFTGSITTGTWYHVAFTADRDGNGILYINGTAVQTTDISSQSGNMNNSNPLRIGCDSSSQQLYYDGKVDDVRIYKQVLSQSEISAIINGGSTPTPTPTPVYLIDDDFDSQTTGSDPDGWTINETGGEIQIAEVPSSSDKSMSVYDNSSTNTTVASKSFTSQSGIITAEFDFKTGQTNKYVGVAYLRDSANTIALNINANSSGKFQYSGSTATEIQSYSANTWYHFKIVLDPSTGKADIYIDSVKKVDQGDFRNAVSEISTFQILTNESASGYTSYWDDVQVYY